MSGEEVNRVRPASGLWSLLGWLRREHSASCDSLSSGGSARTAASFAFLPPAVCAAAAAAPRARPPPSPPSDSYRRRLRERNARRQQEQHLTLHRKYHLPGLYDAHTLPPPRRQPEERAKRAASEVGRRAAHVPGKRPAPPPPTPAPAPAGASLPRRRAKKRPAPPPPLTFPLREKQKSLLLREIEKIDFEMSNAKERDPQTNSDCKQEKYTRKDSNRRERSFLKQLFENKKRNSAIETSSVKLLPNISELDRQATELLQSYRLQTLQQSDTHPRKSGPMERSGISRKNENKAGTWICTSCLQKYEMTVATCLQCLLKKGDKKTAITIGLHKYNPRFEGTSSNAPSTSMSEKEKLKDMLKEMKNSLPKRSKTSNIEKSCNKTRREERDSSEDNDFSKDAPTLPIGEALNDIKHQYQKLVEVNARMMPRNSTTETGGARNILTQNEVHQESEVASTKLSLPTVKENKKAFEGAMCFRAEHVNISTFINPVYIPKPAVDVNKQPSQRASFLNISGETSKLEENKEIKRQVLQVTTANNFPPSTSLSSNPVPKEDHLNKKPISSAAAAPSGSRITPIDKNNKEKKLKDTNIPAESKCSNPSSPDKLTFPPTLLANAGTEKTKETIDQFRKRRDLINQLERSIATGDERAAADAAVQLAQLRLSCSVLSFSSQMAAAKDPPTRKHSISNHINIGNQISSKSNTGKLPTIKVSTASQAISPQSAQTVEGSARKTTDEAEILSSSISYSEAKPSKNNIRLQQTQPSTSKAATTELVNIEVWVEDKTAARGAAQLGVSRAWRLRELRREAERVLLVPAPLQRWIVGRTLCADDDAALTALAGAALDAPFYLCLVESGVTENQEESDKKPIEEQDNGVYHELVQLERNDIVANNEAFECAVCLEECPAGAGCVLRECLHAFCRTCLAEGVRQGAEGEAACPAPGCPAALQEREVRGLVSPADYERWLDRGLALAESGARHAFHCRTRDCAGWALAEPPVQRFPCPVCRAVNCVPCQAIHDGETCDQYKIRLSEAAKMQGTADTMDDSTKTLIASLISRGEALECPECKAIITKKWGCDWVRCSACKTEICWVTRGRRWGPGGRGDTSAGCRCGVDGKRCHPSCAYCH